MTSSKMKQLRGSLLLLLTALIWGSAFVAQSNALDHIGNFTFNGIRMLIGSIVLLPFVFVTGRKNSFESLGKPRTLLWGGLLCGAALCAASSFQNWGIAAGDSVGKAGFITTLYVVLVPLISAVLFKKKMPRAIWICVALATVGLYLLCVSGGFKIQYSDSLLMICALLFSVHILIIDHFSPRVSGVALSCLQFFFCAVISLVLAAFTEEISWLTIRAAAVPILYAGVLSCGVAYTLQVIAQRDTDPAVASLLMSLESVFSVLCGWVLLSQKLSLRQIIGCVLMFAAVILVELSPKKEPK